MDDVMDDEAREALQERLIQLLADETEIVRALERQIADAPSHPDSEAAWIAIHAAVEGHGESLRSQMDVPPGSPSIAPQSPLGDLLDPRLTGQGQTPLLSTNLRALFAAFNYAALGYAALFEMSLRLYDPALREIASQFLEDHAQAAQAMNRLIAPVVAWELLRDDLDCRCICPMCAVGACGCVSACTDTIEEVWQEVAHAADSPPPGFLLQAPRPGSQLRSVGVQGGDRLLEVDGQPVQSFMDVQTALRRHSLGEEVRLRVVGASDDGRDLIVRHLSDYARD